MMKILPGTRFGRLVVLNAVEPFLGKNRRYLCLCACGKETRVWGSGLTSAVEPTRSCGCLHREKSQRPPGQAAFTVLYNRYRKNAEIRKLSFNISLKEAIFLMEQSCFYCGAAPSRFNPYLKKDGEVMKGRTPNSIERAEIRANGIDRRDNCSAYTLSNCVPACPQCNYGKLDWTEEEFIAHCYAVVAHQEKLKKQAA